ncbi:MAG: amidoligase family protein [Deltaproteobacteria bacterium]|nr:amidoligase family protein [Deltaproteobacteria bacterium]
MDASPAAPATRSAAAPLAPRLGVEIETVGRTREHVARAILAVVGGQIAMSSAYEMVVVDPRGRRWACVHDGSLSQAAHAEIVTPILTEADLPELQDVVRAVRACGAQVDRSTGIHIHIDGAPFDGRAVKNLLKIWNKQEDLIFHAFRVSPERRARYCRENDPGFIARLERARPTSKEALNTVWYGGRSSGRQHQRYDSSRYHAVNLHSLFYRGTIEFRLFEGTLRGDEVKAYVQFVLALAKKALSARAASSRKRAFNPDTAKYDFRVFLLHLGFIGDEYKQTREILTKHLRGSAAWKNGRPSRATPTDSTGPSSDRAA